MAKSIKVDPIKYPNNAPSAEKIVAIRNILYNQFFLQ